MPILITSVVPDTLHFTKRYAGKNELLLWSGLTNAVACDSGNALNLRYLHQVAVNEEHLVKAGGFFSIDEDLELHFYNTAHTPGSLGVIVLHASTGEAVLHAGDQRSSDPVCAELAALLETLSLRTYEDGTFHLKSAVGEDTNYGSDEVGDSTSALARIREEISRLEAIGKYYRYVIPVSDCCLSNRFGKFILPLAEELDDAVYLQEDSLAAVQALQRAGHPDSADLSRVAIAG